MPWDHPRSRGEYVWAGQRSWGAWGSSPLSRGILTILEPRLPRHRIIPALAGNTRIGNGRAGNAADHPRSRGEYCRHRWATYCPAGSSPLSRGIRDTAGSWAGNHEIIPALAGNTREPVRGSSITCGSSPLSRGIRCVAARWCVRCGIIPALAGNTSPAAEPSSRSRDHPRSRGEYKGVYRVTGSLEGSSPLSRGIRPRP